MVLVPVSIPLRTRIASFRSVFFFSAASFVFWRVSESLPSVFFCSSSNAFFPFSASSLSSSAFFCKTDFNFSKASLAACSISSPFLMAAALLSTSCFALLSVPSALDLANCFSLTVVFADSSSPLRVRALLMWGFCCSRVWLAFWASSLSFARLLFSLSISASFCATILLRDVSSFLLPSISFCFFSALSYSLTASMVESCRASLSASSFISSSLLRASDSFPSYRLMFFSKFSSVSYHPKDSAIFKSSVFALLSSSSSLSMRVVRASRSFLSLMISLSMAPKYALISLKARVASSFTLLIRVAILV